MYVHVLILCLDSLLICTYDEHHIGRYASGLSALYVYLKNERYDNFRGALCSVIAYLLVYELLRNVSRVSVNKKKNNNNGS